MKCVRTTFCICYLCWSKGWRMEECWLCSHFVIMNWEFWRRSRSYTVQVVLWQLRGVVKRLAGEVGTKRLVEVKGAACIFVPARVWSKAEEQGTWEQLSALKAEINTLLVPAFHANTHTWICMGSFSCESWCYYTHIMSFASCQHCIHTTSFGSCMPTLYPYYILCILQDRQGWLDANDVVQMW